MDEGAVDIDSITDPVELDSILAQINEFGQTPKKIFTKPHPARFSKVIYPINLTLGTARSNDCLWWENENK